MACLALRDIAGSVGSGLRILTRPDCVSILLGHACAFVESLNMQFQKRRHGGVDHRRGMLMMTASKRVIQGI